MHCIRNIILMAVFGWVSVSCNPSEPPPPPPAPQRPAVSSTSPAASQPPSGSGLKPVAVTATGLGAAGGPVANSIGVPSDAQPSAPNIGGAVSAITGLIQSVSNGGGIDSIGASIQNLIGSFTGGASGGGALSGFGNLLSGLIPGLGGTSPTTPSP